MLSHKIIKISLIKCIDNPKAKQIRRQRQANRARDRHNTYHPYPQTMIVQVCLNIHVPPPTMVDILHGLKLARYHQGR